MGIGLERWVSGRRGKKNVDIFLGKYIIVNGGLLTVIFQERRVWSDKVQEPLF
jgi:hypothetical protein